MVAIPFRMGAGYPGDVNRSHPASIEPSIVDATNPPAGFGLPALINSATNGARGLLATDTAVTKLYGITVRPYPYQAPTASGSYGAQGFGSGALAPSQPVDLMRLGYIMATIPAGQTVTKGGPVFVWIAASTGSHVQGGFEGVASTGNTIALDVNRYNFNGPADASGNVEIYAR